MTFKHLLVGSVGVATVGVLGYANHIRKLIRTVEPVPAREVSAFCEKLTPEEPFTVYAYHTTSLLPTAQATRDIYGAWEAHKTFTIEASGAKVTRDTGKTVPGNPAIGSLYALQALEHSCLLRNLHVSRIFWSTFRVSDSWSYLLRTSSAGSKAAREEALKDRSPAALEKAMEGYAKTVEESTGDREVVYSVRHREATILPPKTAQRTVGASLGVPAAPAKDPREVPINVYCVVPRRDPGAGSMEKVCAWNDEVYCRWLTTSVAKALSEL